MKILMFGRGVIATQYGWALEKAGNQVDFYVRRGRSEEYGPYVDLNILDGRKSSKGIKIKERWPVTMHETIAPDHDYDLIIVSVNHEQLGPVMEVIGHRAGKATILMFNNIWDDMQTIIEPLPKDQVIWGFPGGGGGFREQTLQGGITKSVFLEAAGTAASKERHRSVVALLEQAGFSLSLQKDMRSWYWEHFILNAAMAAQVFHEGSYHNLYRSAATVKKAILLMQEMLPLIKARGGKAGTSGKAMMYLPAGLTAYGTYKVIGGNNIMGEIMRQMEDSAYISRESLARFPKDVLAWARHAGISLPGLEALEHYF